MTKIEESAKFIKKQKARIKNEIASLTRIVIDACLEDNQHKKYDIIMDCGTAGKNISFRIYDEDSNQLHSLDNYSIDFVFTSISSVTLNKNEILKGVNKIVSKVKEMKKLALKYSKLNQNINN